MEIPPRITRAYIRQLRDTHYFIYGDSLDWAGDGGQAREARGEPNAFMVPVKYRKCYNDTTAFLSDKYYEENLVLFKQALVKVPNDLLKPIILFPKIGLGYNQMHKRAPKTFRKLVWFLTCMPNVINPEVIPAWRVADAP